VIDFIKINDLSKGQEIRDKLDFEIKVSGQTGELYNRKRTANLQNMIFISTPDDRFLKVQGSLHKYANGGNRNNDRFTFDRFLAVADKLSQYIADDDIINVLEFGVNLPVSFSPSELLKNLISFKQRQINKTLNPGIGYSQVDTAHFNLKIYDKSLQQSTSSNILRVELRYNRMQKLFPDGLRWSQLRDPETWTYLSKVLRQKFSEVIFYDPSIDLNQLPEKDRQFLRDGRNPFYWSDLNGSHVSRTRNKYMDLVKTHGKMFGNLSELLSQELKELAKSYHYSQTEIEMKNRRLAKSYPLLSCNNSPTLKDRMFCKVTGHDISMQKKGSMFLSISGIRDLYQNSPSLYHQLADERLSSRWQRESLDVQIREIAHSIRNEVNNPLHNTRRSLERVTQDPVLFDIMPTIDGVKKRILIEKNLI